MPPKKINDDMSDDDEWSPDQLLDSESSQTTLNQTTTSKTSSTAKKTKKRKKRKGLSASNAGVQTLVASSKRVDLEGLVMRCYELSNFGNPSLLQELFTTSSLTSSLALPPTLPPASVHKAASNNPQTALSTGIFSKLPDVCVLEIIQYHDLRTLLSFSQTCLNFLSSIKQPLVFSKGFLAVTRIPVKTFPKLPKIFDFSQVKDLYLYPTDNTELHEIKYFLESFHQKAKGLERVKLRGKKFRSSTTLAAQVGKLYGSTLKHISFEKCLTLKALAEFCPCLESIEFDDFDGAKCSLPELARISGLVRQSKANGKYTPGKKTKLDTQPGTRETPTVKTLINKIKGKGGWNGMNIACLFTSFPTSVPELSNFEISACHYTPPPNFTLNTVLPNSLLLNLTLTNFNHQSYFSLIKPDSYTYISHLITVRTRSFFSSLSPACPNLETLSVHCSQKSKWWSNTDCKKYGSAPKLWPHYVRADDLGGMKYLRSVVLEGFAVYGGVGFGSSNPNLSVFKCKCLLPKSGEHGLKSLEDVEEFEALAADLEANCSSLKTCEVKAEWFEEEEGGKKPRIMFAFRHEWKNMTAEEMETTERYTEEEIRMMGQGDY
ncbi:hypothetical protein TrVE_jg4121 [Triparma verrucosa]|uniref:F-box domain-containing protein n=1 Tax=Triparma verrucosa TaxID=1606542 RepID=A0A9W7CCM1_9STRA|nr:hypothetical protein TrVE_jg4121 [Triparma verrucosa]